MDQVSKGSLVRIDWDSLDAKLDFHDIVTKALETISIPNSRRQGRNTRPFVTSYQLASKVAQLFPYVVRATGLRFGGRGTGIPQSFVQELAAELSARIALNGTNYGIEIEYLSTDSITAIQFSVSPGVNDGNSEYESSVTGSDREIALFRLR